MNYPEFTIYTIPNCLYCSKAKELLNDYNVIYSEILLNKNEYIEIVNIKIKTNTQIKTAPQILNKNELVGGYTELTHFLNNYYFDF